MNQLRKFYNPKVWDIFEILAYLGYHLHGVKGTPCSCTNQRWTMTGAVWTLSRIRLLKVLHAYSRVKSSQLLMNDWIYSFNNTVCDLVYCAYCSHRYVTVFSSYLSTIETLTGSNYKKYKWDIELVLDLMDLDMCLLKGKPTVSNDDTSTRLMRHW